MIHHQKIGTRGHDMRKKGPRHLNKIQALPNRIFCSHPCYNFGWFWGCFSFCTAGCPRLQQTKERHPPKQRKTENPRHTPKTCSFYGVNKDMKKKQPRAPTPTPSQPPSRTSAPAESITPRSSEVKIPPAWRSGRFGFYRAEEKSQAKQPQRHGKGG